MIIIFCRGRLWSFFFCIIFFIFGRSTARALSFLMASSSFWRHAPICESLKIWASHRMRHPGFAFVWKHGKSIFYFPELQFVIWPTSWLSILCEEIALNYFGFCFDLLYALLHWKPWVAMIMKYVFFLKSKLFEFYYLSKMFDGFFLCVTGPPFFKKLS